MILTLFHQTPEGGVVSGYFSQEEWALACNSSVSLEDARSALFGISGSLSEAVIAKREDL